MQPRHHRPVHPHRARGAVLDQEARVALLDVVQPGEQRPRVLEQARAGSEPAGVRARAGHGVVVHLEEADAVVADEPVDDPVEVRPCGGAPQVEQVPAVVGDAHAAPGEEGVVRAGRRRAATARRSPRARARAPAPSRARGSGRAPRRCRRGTGSRRAATRRPCPTSGPRRTSRRRCRSSPRRPRPRRRSAAAASRWSGRPSACSCSR